MLIIQRKQPSNSVSNIYKTEQLALFHVNRCGQVGKPAVEISTAQYRLPANRGVYK